MEYFKNLKSSLKKSPINFLQSWMRRTCTPQVFYYTRIIFTFIIFSYEHPTHPGYLNIPANTPLITDLTIIDNHKKYISIFRQRVYVEKVLKKQAVSPIYKLYIKELRHSQTHMFIMKVAELLTHIFVSYGLVDATKISGKEQKVALMV